MNWKARSRALKGRLKEIEKDVKGWTRGQPGLRSHVLFVDFPPRINIYFSVVASKMNRSITLDDYGELVYTNLRDDEKQMIGEVTTPLVKKYEFDYRGPYQKLGEVVYTFFHKE